MKGRVLLYGATGRCGQAIAAALADLGARLVLGGRAATNLEPLAGGLGVEARVLAADAGMAAGLSDIGLVVNMAGPFQRTAAPVIDACLQAGADYCDIAGEWPVFAAADARDAEAGARGVMLLPGIGFATAATDCLLAMTAARFPGTMRLRLGLSRPHDLSPGSVATLWAMNDRSVRIRRDGSLHERPAASLWHAFDFGAGYERAIAVSWPDLVTVHRSTGVDVLEVYSAVGPLGEAAIRVGAFAAPLFEAFRSNAADRPGRTAAPRPKPPQARHGFILVAEALDRWRRVRSMSMRTPDGYSATTLTAAGAVRAWLAGKRRPGFHTPSGLFGPHFVLDCGAGELVDPTR
jgi:short subunit dehydrogenase-like uncharacterized protein